MKRRQEQSTSAAPLDLRSEKHQPEQKPAAKIF